MKRNIFTTRCIPREIEFTKETVPLLGSVSDKTNIQGQNSMEYAFCGTVEAPMLPPRPDPSMDNKLLSMQLCKRATMPPYSQTRVQVPTKTNGFIHLGPKPALQATYHTRAVNGTQM